MVLGQGDTPWAPLDGCHARDITPLEVVCRFGSAPPSRVVALVGDSHAQEYQAPLVDIGRKRGWELHFWFRGGGVPGHVRRLPDVRRPLPPGRVLRRLGAPGHAAPAGAATQLVVSTGYAAGQDFDSEAAGEAGFASVWREWQESARLVVVRDHPRTLGTFMPECLSQHPGDQLACSRPRSQALSEDPMTLAARRMASPRLTLVDLSRAFCDRDRCYPVVGGVPSTSTTTTRADRSSALWPPISRPT